MPLTRISQNQSNNKEKLLLAYDSKVFRAYEVHNGLSGLNLKNRNQHTRDLDREESSFRVHAAIAIQGF